MTIYLSRLTGLVSRLNVYLVVLFFQLFIYKVEEIPQVFADMLSCMAANKNHITSVARTADEHAFNRQILSDYYCTLDIFILRLLIYSVTVI